MLACACHRSQTTQDVCGLKSELCAFWAGDRDTGLNAVMTSTNNLTSNPDLNPNPASKPDPTSVLNSEAESRAEAPDAAGLSASASLSSSSERRTAADATQDRLRAVGQLEAMN